MRALYKDFYRKLKPKDRQLIDDRVYYDLFTQTWGGMFNYALKDPVEELKKLLKQINYALEYFLRLYGVVGFFKNKKGQIKFGRAVWGSNPTQDGFSEYVTVNTLDGETKTGKVGEDIAVIFNNKNGSGDFCIHSMIEYLTEIDKSQYDLLLNSREHPIITAPDEETKSVIDQALAQRKLGYTATVACSGAIGNELLAGKSGIDVITLTDPNTATLFQYYEHHHKDILDRFYGKYGVSTCNTNKMAQTNDLEVSGTISTSLIVPIENMRCRKDGLEMLRDVIGLDLAIEWGDVWRTQLQLFENLDATKNVMDGNTADPKNDETETKGKIDPNSDENKGGAL